MTMVPEQEDYFSRVLARAKAPEVIKDAFQDRPYGTLGLKTTEVLFTDNLKHDRQRFPFVPIVINRHILDEAFTRIGGYDSQLERDRKKFLKDPKTFKYNGSGNGSLVGKFNKIPTLSVHNRSADITAVLNSLLIEDYDCTPNVSNSVLFHLACSIQFGGNDIEIILEEDANTLLIRRAAQDGGEPVEGLYEKVLRLTGDGEQFTGKYWVDEEPETAQIEREDYINSYSDDESSEGEAPDDSTLVRLEVAATTAPDISENLPEEEAFEEIAGEYSPPEKIEQFTFTDALKMAVAVGVGYWAIKKLFKHRSGLLEVISGESKTKKGRWLGPAIGGLAAAHAITQTIRSSGHSSHKKL